MQRRLEEEVGYYVLFRDTSGRGLSWVNINADTGRVLTHFLIDLEN